MYVIIGYCPLLFEICLQCLKEYQNDLLGIGDGGGVGMVWVVGAIPLASKTSFTFNNIVEYIYILSQGF